MTKLQSTHMHLFTNPYEYYDKDTKRIANLQEHCDKSEWHLLQIHMKMTANTNGYCHKSSEKSTQIMHMNYTDV